MTKTDTLVILTPGFPAEEPDTSCIPSLQVFVEACKKNNPALHIIVLSFQYPFRSGTYEWKGVTVWAFDGRSRGGVYRLNTWRRVWMRLHTIRRTNRIRGILSFWLGECALLGKYYAALHRIPHFTWILGQDARAGNRYQKKIRPAGKNLVAVSDFVATEYRRNYNILPAHVIPVGVDPAYFGPLPGQRDIDIMGAGSLIPLKRYKLFIEVVAELKRSNPQVFAVICGKGPEKARLQEQIRLAGLQRNIHLMDELPHRDVLQVMQRSKVFFHSSEYEGYGMVCAEALYAGAEVVSFCRSMDELPARHHVVETTAAAVSKIRELLQDPDKQYTSVLQYPASEISKQMLALFGL